VATHVDQNFDHYSCEYTFKDGAKLYLEGRTASTCTHNQFSTQVHGTQGCAMVSTAGHFPSKAAMTYNSQNMSSAKTSSGALKQPEAEPLRPRVAGPHGRHRQRQALQ
jgi:hypothetical protein